MKRFHLLFWGGLILAMALLVLGSGCTKERIVESTQYVKDVEYVQLPGDTVLEIHTVYDTITVHTSDTVRLVDTVGSSGSEPNQLLAIAAMQYYTDPQVLEFAQSEFGLNDGWIFYLSSFQLAAEQAAPGVYDLAGYIDFWAPDWSGYYPLEFMWRLTYKGGDASVPSNWVQSEPPSAVAGHQPGMRRITAAERATKAAR